MVERRTSTGELRLLGGMARGRPLLATVLMTTGIIALAVPLSSSFAGEFLILAGVFQQHWVWGVIGAAAIVLAAMYMLRLISAVLHQEVGPAVPEQALDLRLGELAVVVPLVACLLALSAYPNLISGHAFGGKHAAQQVSGGIAYGPAPALPLTKLAADLNLPLNPPATRQQFAAMIQSEIADGILIVAGYPRANVRNSFQSDGRTFISSSQYASAWTRYAP
jgi:NADH:ubiquinone oxidoreductase subunit 5 (subunit L)/multisubunit Na+/H+ antiporter MnhA subunit